MIERFDHLGIAVWSIRDAVPLFRDVFGGTFVVGGDDHRLGIRTAMFKLPVQLKIELIEPLDESSYMHRYLTRSGPGFHHATIFFPDVEAAIADLQAHGFELVDTDLSQSSWRETYIRPTSGFGCLFQIVDSDLDWLTPHPEATLDEVLDGRWQWANNRIRRA